MVRSMKQKTTQYIETNRDWISIPVWAGTEIEILDRNTRNQIARVYGDDEWTRSERARLIAAAPEMLAALEGILWDLADESYADIQNMRDTIQAAISKARGEA